MIKKETVIKLLDDEITKQKELIEHYQHTIGIMFADNESTDELLVLEKIKDMINKLPTINQ